MAKKFYVLDENGTIKSADGSKRYTLLEGQALYDFLCSPASANREFYKAEDAEGNVVRIEVPQDKLSKYWKATNREKYLSREKKKKGVIVVAYDRLKVGGEIISGDEVFLDEGQTAEEMVLEDEEKKSLKDALRSLTEEELYIIKGLYLDTPRRTELMLANDLGVSQPAIHYRKLSILKKIKKFLG